MRRRLCALLVVVVAGLSALLAAPGTAGARTGPLVITYEVRGRGNVSDLAALAEEAAAVYADARGWSLGGSVRFERVAAGGAFTLWLAADALMSSFGGACDVEWSCRNGRNVVINEDRWLGASDSWNETWELHQPPPGQARSPLATYRQMVLNHETGHWLGFGHGTCSGPGRPAPVMQQQSMTLAVCVPNPWPLPTERSTLAARRGVPIVQTGGIVDPPATTAPIDGACLGRLGRAPLRPWTRCL